jgi:hypothetical protein
MKSIIITIIVCPGLIIPATAHTVQPVDEVYLDVTPKIDQFQSSVVHVEIIEYSTVLNLASIASFTIRHGMYLSLNFTNIDLEKDGMEAYQLILHQDIYLDSIIDIPLGSISKELSSNALHDEFISTFYVLGNLNYLDEFASKYIERLDDFIEKGKKLNEFKIVNKLEFIRGTQLNASFDINYDVKSYEVPVIHPDNFHHRLVLQTQLLPQTITVRDTSIIGSTDYSTVLLPINLVPDFFTAPSSHSFNLTKIPITLNLDLSFSDHISRNSVTIPSSNYKSSSGNMLSYNVYYEIEQSQVFSLEIKTRDFTGTIDTQVTIKVRSIFGDNSLYAKNKYPLSPNQYLLIIVISLTIFIYKIVDYVDYRKFQNSLAYKNYGLLEEEFLGN